MQLENTKLLSFSLKHFLSMFRLKYESQSFKNDSEHKYPENKKVFLEGGAKNVEFINRYLCTRSHPPAPLKKSLVRQ